MSYQSELAAQWRDEIERLRHSIAAFEAGTIKLWVNRVDVSDEHLDTLRRMVEELERSLPILESATDA